MCTFCQGIFRVAPLLKIQFEIEITLVDFFGILTGEYPAEREGHLEGKREFLVQVKIHCGIAQGGFPTVSERGGARLEERVVIAGIDAVNRIPEGSSDRVRSAPAEIIPDSKIGPARPADLVSRFVIDFLFSPAQREVQTGPQTKSA